jgi:hypothetical protein
MTERNYRLLLGLAVLILIYFDQRAGMVALIALLTAEGVSNWRIPALLGRVRHGIATPCDAADMPWRFQPLFKIPFDAQRALRLIVAGTLFLSALALPEALWFFPWFLGFALIGSALSGVCPMLIALRKLGFS